MAGLDRAARLTEYRGESIDDALRPAPGNGPATHMCQGAEHQCHGCVADFGQRHRGMGCQAGEQRFPLLGVKPLLGNLGRNQSSQTQSSQRERVGRNPQDRTEHSVGKSVPFPSHSANNFPIVRAVFAEELGGEIDRVVDDSCPASV